jgi:hypothetical protein
MVMKLLKMLNLKLYAILLFFGASSHLISAQISSSIVESAKSPYQKIAVGLNLGTKGFGIEGAMTLNRYFNVRLGFNHSRFQYFNNAFQLPSFLFNDDAELRDQKYQLDLDYRQSNIEVLGEYKPFGAAFRLVAGFAFFPKNKIVSKAVANDTYFFNDVPLDPDEIGSVGLTWGYQSNISPYFGLGFGRAVPQKRRFGVSFDLGTYYKGKPTIGIEATAALRENVRNAPILEENLSKVSIVRFFPVASLRFAYRIN